MDQETMAVPPDAHADFAPEDLEPRPFTAPPRRRVLWILAVLCVLVLLAVVPPLINVNRYQKRIAQSIGLSLGRPVHTGDVSLDLLPWPGFTISNFVVSEDPAFGVEPVIRASSVKARLRWRSLWRGRVEFSRITLSDASVNLVRESNGQWNLESILLQASRMPAAPTAQRGAGDRPRFPYIEATNARVNVKMGLEKMPLSLTEADFALWLPEAEQWRLRLEAHPARTDTAATDTGVLRLEGTFGRAAHLADVPVDLHASWTAAPLGAASYVLAGNDAGLRGELNLSAAIQGTAGRNALTADLRMTRVRRADFVPPHLMDVDLHCTAEALGNLHRLENLRCAWPAGTPDTGLVVTGEVPDTLTPGTATLQADVKSLPAEALVEAAQLFSRRLAPDLTLDGTLNAHATCCSPGTWLTSLTAELTKPTLKAGGSTLAAADELHADGTGDVLALPSSPVDLGGSTPARLNLNLSPEGYDLRLTGSLPRARLAAVAAALPPFSDGLQTLPSNPADGDLVNFDQVCRRNWHGTQQWSTPEIVQPPTPRARHTPHRGAP